LDSAYVREGPVTQQRHSFYGDACPALQRRVSRSSDESGKHPCIQTVIWIATKT